MSPEASVAPKKRTITRKTTANSRVAAAAKRKAPTPKKVVHNNFSYIKLYAALLFAFIVVTSISVFIGTRDKGIIDVKATISARAALEEAKGNTELSEQIRSAGKSQTVNREIDDALVGAGNRITEQQKRAKNNATAPAVTASSSATSTVATSTETVSGEEDAEETAGDAAGTSETETVDETITEESSSESNDGEENGNSSVPTEEIDQSGESRGL